MFKIVAKSFNDKEKSDIEVEINKTKIYVSHLIVDEFSTFIKTAKKYERKLLKIECGDFIIEKYYTKINLTCIAKPNEVKNYFKIIYGMKIDLLTFEEWKYIYIVADYFNDEKTKSMLHQCAPSLVRPEKYFDMYRDYKCIDPVFENLCGLNEIPMHKIPQYSDLIMKCFNNGACLTEEYACINSLIASELCLEKNSQKNEFDIIEYITFEGEYNIYVSVLAYIIRRFNLRKIPHIEKQILELFIIGTYYNIRPFDIHNKISPKFKVRRVNGAKLIDKDLEVPKNIRETLTKYWNKLMDENDGCDFIL